jgi:hypothetical protein
VTSRRADHIVSGFLTRYPAYASSKMAGQKYYDRVSGDENSIELDQPAEKPSVAKRWSWSQQSFLIRTIIIAVYTVLIAGLCSVIVEYRHHVVVAPSTAGTVADADTSAVVVPSTNTTQSSPTDGLDQIQHCGSNWEEATALGCVYDVMMQLWMPPACYDTVLTERFLKEGNWTWWADPEASRIMSDEEMREGKHTVAFMLQSYHKHHCVFAMEKLVRALRNDWPLIPELVSYDHIVHCRHKTLMRTDPVRGVRAPTGFTSCAPYDVWKNQLPEDHVSSTD